MDFAHIISAEWLVHNLLRLGTAAAVLAGGWALSAFLSRSIMRLLPRTGRVDLTILPLMSQIVRYTVLIVTVIIVLGQFGVETASILAVLGAIGLAIALALQGTLSNMAAGVMLIWLRPFNVGDAIDAEGISGSVVEIGLFGTRLRTYDGVYVFTPNQKLWNAKVINWSRELTRMVETKVRISYESSIATAREVLLNLAKDPRVLPDPAPSVFVSSLGDSAMEMTLRSWTASSDWWNVNIDFLERAKLQLEAAGVRIAYNTYDIHLTGTDVSGVPPQLRPAANGNRAVRPDA